MVPVMTVMLLAKPGPPIPLVKGVVLGLVIAALLLAGVLMVPILEHYPVTGVVLTGALFYAVFYTGARKANPLTLFMHVALVFIPVAGVADQAATTVLARTVGVALVIGVLASAVSHALVSGCSGAGESRGGTRRRQSGSGKLDRPAGYAGRDARVHAGAHQPGLLSAARHENGRAGHSRPSATNARTAGRELVGSTLVGAVLAMVVWGGLTLRPNLWMFALVDRGRIALGRRQAVPGQGHTFPSVVLAQRPDDDVLRAGTRHRRIPRTARMSTRCCDARRACLSW